MAREKPRGVSLRPEDAIDAGLWMGGDAVIEEAVFTEYDYGGTVRSRNLPIVLLVTYRHAEGTYEQPYSCGDGWEIGDKGAMLVPTKGQKGLPKSSNAYQFFKSLEDVDYDLADLDESVRALEGQGVTCSRQAQPDRSDFKRDDRRSRGGRDDDKKDDQKKTYILIDALLDKAPKFDKAKGKAEKPKGKASRDDEDDEDEKPRGSVKGRGRGRDDDDEDDEDEEKPKTRSRSRKDEDDEDERPARGKGKGKADDDDDLDEEAEDALIEVLEKAGAKGLKLDAIEEAVYAHLKGHPARKAVAAKAGDEDFIAGLKKKVAFDGKTAKVK